MSHSPKMEKFTFPENRPEGDWINWRIGSGWFEVAGTKHRIDDVLSFLRDAGRAAAAGQPFGIRLECEPNNPHHAGAIKVLGIIGEHANPSAIRHIGYVPRETADEVYNLYQETPTAAELKQIKVGDTTIYVSVAGLIPKGTPKR